MKKPATTPKSKAKRYITHILNRIGKHEHGQQTREDHAGNVGCQHDAAGRKPIGQCAAHQHEDRARQSSQGQHGTQHDGVAADAQHQPGQRGLIELIAQ